MSGRHSDEDGDGVADQGLSDPFADRQAAAFAHADPDELVTDDDIAVMHELGQLRDVTAGPVISPAEHDAAGWDVGREGPKSAQEAAAALATRQADPSAPDALTGDPDPYRVG